MTCVNLAAGALVNLKFAIPFALTIPINCKSGLLVLALCLNVEEVDKYTVTVPVSNLVVKLLPNLKKLDPEASTPD